MENKVSYEQMETVWEHNITKEEKEALFGVFETWEREDLSDFTQNDHYGLIYRLYLYRGDKETAKKYADKMSNTIEKVFGTCYHDWIY